MGDATQHSHEPSDREGWRSHSTQHLQIQLPVVPSQPAADGRQSPFAQPPPPASDAGGELQAEEPAHPLQHGQRSNSHMVRQSSLLLQPLRRSGVLVYSFGRGDCGQLGIGSAEDTPTPTSIDALQGKDVVSVSGSSFHTAAVSGDGELYVFGSNDTSQLGLRNLEQALCPTRLEALENFSVASVACGSSHTVAVVDDGAVAAWGASEFGQCGLESTATQVDYPRLVKALKDAHIARVAAGGNHTVMLASSGDVYSCGDGTFGALGHGVTENCSIPKPILSLWPLGVVQISCGDSHSAALTVDGQLFTFGRGKYGQLGLGGFDSRNTPTRVRALAGVLGQQVSCGGDHTALLSRDGQLYTWGRGTWGQTGLGHCENVSYPKRVEALEGQQLLQVSAGGRHSLALTSNNELWGFGCSENGQLSIGATGNVSHPRQVAGLPNYPILYVEAAGDHSLVVMQRASQGDLVSIGPSHSRPHGESTLPLPLPNLRHLTREFSAASNNDAAKRGELCHAVEVVFSCPAFLIHTMAGKDPWLVGTAQPHCMDTEDTADSTPARLAADDQAEEGQIVGLTYEGLLRLYDTDVIHTLGAACVRLLDTLETYLTSMRKRAEQAQRSQLTPQQQQVAAAAEDVDWVACVLFILLQNPLNGDGGGIGGQLVMRISRIVAATLQGAQRAGVRQALQQLLQGLPPEMFAARCVRPIQRYIDSLVNSGKMATARLQMLMAGVLLDVLRQANDQADGTVPYQEFYNKALSEAANLREEYFQWVQHRDSAPAALLSLCQMPYLLTPEAKSRILRGEAMAQQQSSMASATMQAFFSGAGNPALAGYLAIQVRRTNVVEDALNQIMYRQQDLKKPLRVTFISGGVAEPAQDEGGVTKEFFQLLTREIFRPEYGMFTYRQERGERPV